MREHVEHGIMLLVAGVLGFISVLLFGFWIGALLALACSCAVFMVFARIFSVLKTRRDTLESSQKDRRHHE